MSNVQSVNVSTDSETFIKFNIKNEYKEYESFKYDFKNIYSQLLNQQIFQKKTTIHADIHVVFFSSTILSNDKKIFNLSINKSIDFYNQKINYVNNTYFKVTPLKEIKKFLIYIHNKLLELWNTSTSFDELEFLLFHINEMPPIGKIIFQNRSNMLMKIKYILNAYPHIVRGIDKLSATGIAEDLKREDFLQEDLLKLEQLIYRHLIEDDDYFSTFSPVDKSEKLDKSISLRIELLGYGTTSNYEGNFINKGEIGLNLELLKNFSKTIDRHSSFDYFKKLILNYYGFNINKKDFSYEKILEKVFYHEFGHLYFGHCNLNSSNVSTLNTAQESYANFFASMMFDNQQKSLLIWMQTRFQLMEYQKPILLKVTDQINSVTSRNQVFSINLKNYSVKSFKEHCQEEQMLRLNSSGNNK